MRIRSRVVGSSAAAAGMDDKMDKQAASVKSRAHRRTTSRSAAAMRRRMLHLDTMRRGNWHQLQVPAQQAERLVEYMSTRTRRCGLLSQESPNIGAQR